MSVDRLDERERGNVSTTEELTDTELGVKLLMHVSVEMVRLYSPNFGRGPTSR